MNLKNIDLKIKKGSCVAIIGKTGSGKSSLLNSIFNEMFEDRSKKTCCSKKRQTIKIRGSVSYLPQSAKFMSKTMKENILFFSEYEENQYKDAIYYSAMSDDLDILLDKDQTMLGDKGVNLSGGQKTRLGIARCLYSNKDIIILDDPISALDINVGKFVMENTIKGYLKNKTRIITTHAIAYLKYFDYIYIMDQGEIVQHGSYDFIKQTEEYKEIQNIILEENKKKELENPDDIDKLIQQSEATVSNLPVPDDFTEEFKHSICSISDESNELDNTEVCSTKNFGKIEIISEINLKDDQAEKVANIIQDEEKGKTNFEFETLKKFIVLRGGVKFLLVQILFVCCFKALNAKLSWFIADWSTSLERSIYTF